MGAFAKTLLQLLAAAVLLAIGYFFPSALASTLSWLDAAVASIADNAEPTGTLKLILQFAGAGFAVLMALLVIAAGFTMRQFVSQTLFRWRYVMTAGLIPLLAHVVKWGLGLWWPTLLVPVHTLTGGVYNWFSPETQIQLDLFNFKGHVMTIILGLVLILLWLLVTFIWRWFFGSKAAASAPPPQTPAPSGNSKWSKIMSIFEKPIKFYREKIMPIFSKFYNGVRADLLQTLQLAQGQVSQDSCTSRRRTTTANPSTATAYGHHGLAQIRAASSGADSRLHLERSRLALRPGHRLRADQLDSLHSPAGRRSRVHNRHYPGTCRGAVCAIRATGTESSHG